MDAKMLLKVLGLLGALAGAAGSLFGGGNKGGEKLQLNLVICSR